MADKPIGKIGGADDASWGGDAVVVSRQEAASGPAKPSPPARGGVAAGGKSSTSPREPTIAEGLREADEILYNLASTQAGAMFVCTTHLDDGAGVRLRPIPGFELLDKATYVDVVRGGRKTYSGFGPPETFVTITPIQPAGNAFIAGISKRIARPISPGETNRCPHEFWEEVSGELFTMLEPYIHFDKIRDVLAPSTKYEACSEAKRPDMVMKLAEAAENLVRLCAELRVDRGEFYKLLH